jgi:hypothetical protein
MLCYIYIVTIGTAFDTVNVVVALVPHNVKRPPSKEPYNPQTDKGTEIKFEEQEIKTQQYMTTNGFRVSLKPVLTKVFRYEKYTPLGEPMYYVVLQMISIIDKIDTTAACISCLLNRKANTKMKLNIFSFDHM